MTQCERVLQYLEDFGSITSADAFVDLGVMRLASRVNDLRKAGYKIISMPETGRNRYGEKTCYTRYRMEGQ